MNKASCICVFCPKIVLSSIDMSTRIVFIILSRSYQCIVKIRHLFNSK